MRSCPRSSIFSPFLISFLAVGVLLVELGFLVFDDGLAVDDVLDDAVAVDFDLDRHPLVAVDRSSSANWCSAG